jgi:hypothetical protein
LPIPTPYLFNPKPLKKSLATDKAALCTPFLRFVFLIEKKAVDKSLIFIMSLNGIHAGYNFHSLIVILHTLRFSDLKFLKNACSLATVGTLILIQKPFTIRQFSIK